jgi:regulator of Ty1 transposition protein 103
VKAPDASKLIAMLQDLEKSASSDAVVRQTISELPARISDLNSLGKINNRHEASELEKQVKAAVELLDGYNKRLQDELINRKKVALLLNAFIKQQQSEIETDRNCLLDWEQKVKNVQNVKTELEIHAKNLPDLKMIDDIAQLPLPSPTDLFS